MTKNFTSSFLSLLIFSLLVISCEKDEIKYHNITSNTSQWDIENLDANGIISKKIHIKDFPIVNDYLNTRMPLRSSNTSSRLESSFGEVSLENIQQVADTLGNANYTFAIYTSNYYPNRLFNLVIESYGYNTEFNSYIIEYAMSDSFALTFATGESNFGNFQGFIRSYDAVSFLEGGFRNSRNMDDCVEIPYVIPLGDGACSDTEINSDDNDTSDGPSGDPIDGDNNSDSSGGGGGSGGEGGSGVGSSSGSGGGGTVTCTTSTTLVECDAGGGHYGQASCRSTTNQGYIAITESCSDGSSSEITITLRSSQNRSCGGSMVMAVNDIPFKKLDVVLGLSEEEKTCLNDNCDLQNTIYQNLNTTSLPLSTALDFANLVVDQINDDCSIDFEVDFALNNINRINNPCARSIFNELEEGIYVDDPLSPEVQIVGNNTLTLNFTEVMLELFNRVHTFNYIINDGVPSNPIANASTIGLSTTLNSNYLSQATELSIARTIIHEILHAYLNFNYSNPFSSDAGIDFRLKMNQYAIDNGITNINSNEYHHSFMGQYINAMAFSLYQWDAEYGSGGGLGWDYYKAMAFSGQFTVDFDGNIESYSETFSELIPDADDRQEIVDIVINEQLNNNDALGSNCE